MAEVTDKHIAAEIDVLRVITNALHGKDRFVLKLLAERFPDHSSAVRKLREACEKSLTRLPGTYCGNETCTTCSVARTLRAALAETIDFA